MASSEHFSNSTLPPFGYSVCFTETYYGVAFVYSVMILCILVGTPTNVWYLWTAYRFGWRIKPTQVFPLNSMIMDLIACLECYFELLNQFFFQNNQLLIGTTFFYGMSWTGRPVMQTCMCVEQYLAVIHPIWFMRHKSIKYRIMAVVVALLISLGYGLYSITTIKFPDPVFNSIFFITVAIISFCCASVMRALKKPGPGVIHMQVQTGKDVGNQEKKNAFDTIVSSLLIVLFTYIPMIILTVCYSTLKHNWVFYYCNFAPFLGSFCIFPLIFTPLMKINQMGHLKCFK